MCPQPYNAGPVLTPQTVPHVTAALWTERAELSKSPLLEMPRKLSPTCFPRRRPAGRVGLQPGLLTVAAGVACQVQSLPAVTRGRLGRRRAPGPGSLEGGARGQIPGVWAGGWHRGYQTDPRAGASASLCH